MGAGSPPDPTAAAISGINQTEADYPFSYISNALQQLGQSGTVINPSTGQPETLDFTGLGTADVQNQTQNQMAQALLAIQQKYGSGYIQQALQDLQQSDPQGYQAYQQLYSQINQQQNAPAPNLPLATSTQTDELNNLTGSQTLTPEELSQTQQGVRGNQVASGLYLGNAPAQAEAAAVVGATDQKNNAAEQASGQYLAAGVSPEDIQYQQLQQDMANYGAFINGQTPTAQFSQIGGAQGGAAPYLNTGYQTPTMNESTAANEGISNAEGIYSANQQEANPYLAGLNFASQGVGVAANAGLFSGGASPYIAPTITNPNYLGTASAPEGFGTPIGSQNIGGIDE